jgi:hypothetical protein
MNEPYIQHTFVIINSDKILTIYGASEAEPGIVRGRCYCDAPITITTLSHPNLQVVIAHDELLLASTSLTLLFNWEADGIAPIGFDFVSNVCRAYDEWAGLL